MDNRRDFIKKTSLLGLAGITAKMFGGTDFRQLDSTFAELLPGTDLPPLPYAYDALEPFIDAETMKIHHTKHHQAYIDKLKTAQAADFDPKIPLEESCKKVDDKTSALVRNNLGGHYNHSFFWPLMKANGAGKPNAPSGKLDEAIRDSFKSFMDFRTAFADKATKQFGSGWAWLIVDEKKKLKITSTPNQDNPLMKVAAEQGTPILGIDVWEHAYYLKYQNKRAEYVNQWWNVVNWDRVSELYTAAIK